MMPNVEHFMTSCDVILGFLGLWHITRLAYG